MSNINPGQNPNDSHPATDTDIKGDIYVSLGNGLGFVRLEVGADATVLTADSTKASGLKWS